MASLDLIPKIIPQLPSLTECSTIGVQLWCGLIEGLGFKDRAETNPENKTKGKALNPHSPNTQTFLFLGPLSNCRYTQTV